LKQKVTEHVKKKHAVATTTDTICNQLKNDIRQV